MKKQSNKPTDVFIVNSGYRDDNQLRFLTFDYKEALANAKKIVNRINRKNGQKEKLKAKKFYSAIKKENELPDTSGFGEFVVDYWKNNISFVEIVLFKIKKEYSPDWNSL